MASLICTRPPDFATALTNCVIIHPDDYVELSQMEAGKKSTHYLRVLQCVFTMIKDERIKKGSMGMGKAMRSTCQLSMNQSVSVEPWIPGNDVVFASSIQMEVEPLKSKVTAVDVDDLSIFLMERVGKQAFVPGQKIVLDFQGANFTFTIKSCKCQPLTSLVGLTSEIIQIQGDGVVPPVESPLGILMDQTVLHFIKAPGSKLKLAGGSGKAGDTGMNPIFRPDFNFEEMGIGGLDKEFSNIFRRAFASRVFPASVVAKLGIQHVKGLLLYGPPGTGKTLMARKIGEMLNCSEPKVVNGPEILSKFVGQSEENIRNLFADAAKEEEERGAESELHIIIFDEIDAICRQRGTDRSGTGVGDTVVNQILSMMDGVNQLNNILVIGMTNRLDLIDDALLRPGRFEVHMEINLPDKQGRLEILRIHTTKISQSQMMGEHVDLEELSILTKNFSGAEIAGLVKSATSFAMNRQVDPKNVGKASLSDNLIVTREDFMHALGEVKPAFGISEDEFEPILRNGIVEYGAEFNRLMATCKMFGNQVRASERTPLVSILLEGQAGCGKSALAAKLAMESGFPFIKLLSPDSLGRLEGGNGYMVAVGMSDWAKVQRITRFFMDAYKSPLSCLVVDDVERLIDYVPIGPRFSNSVLQCLHVLFKKIPPKGRKLWVVATTSNRNLLEDLQLTPAFNAVIHVPLVSRPEEFKTILRSLDMFEEEELSQVASSFHGAIGIKRLLMLAEMARHAGGASKFEKFVEIIQEFMTDPK